MPLYEFRCQKGHVEEHLLDTDQRNTQIKCKFCHKPLKRLPGGKGLLYFEEGRARQSESLGGKPIASYGDHQKRMRQAGVTDSGNYLPDAIRKNPKSIAMKRHLERDQPGRWV